MTKTQALFHHLSMQAERAGIGQTDADRLVTDMMRLTFQLVDQQLEEWESDPGPVTAAEHIMYRNQFIKYKP